MSTLSNFDFWYDSTDTIKIFDVSRNKLEGAIPIELGEFQKSKVYLSQNELL